MKLNKKSLKKELNGDLGLEAEVKPEVKEEPKRPACSNCKGEGLVKAGTKDVICEVCGGTGKV